MGKLNTSTRFYKEQIEKHPDVTTNHEGGIAFKLSTKLELYSRVATCLLGEKKFYKDEKDGVVMENGDDFIFQLIDKVAESDPLFILQLAQYARNELHLRTIPIVLLGEAAIRPQTKQFVRKYTPSIIQRADELTEVIAYIQSKIGHLGNQSSKGSLPSALKRGIADSFTNFNEYGFAKYNRDGFVKLKDVLRLVHPKPANEERSALYKRIATDSLVTPDTWEVRISTKGSTKEQWQQALEHMPIMATLRNLRNLLDKEVDISLAIARLTDEKVIANSKQFPFRFISAYKEIENHKSLDTPRVLGALEHAMLLSTKNLPRFEGTTAIFADTSGSMECPISERSKVTRTVISCVMLTLANHICDRALTGVFSDSFTKININPTNGILSEAMAIIRRFGGGATYGYETVKYLVDNKIHVDRVIMFTDMELYGGQLVQEIMNYRRKVNKNMMFYQIDLAGYGTAQMPENDPKSVLIGGWSDRILEFVKMSETNATTALDNISRTTPSNKKGD